MSQAEPSKVIRAISTAVGPYFSVEGGAQDGGAYVWVRYGDECLNVDTGRAGDPIISKKMIGMSCVGG
jgi:hypothetical protein